MTVSYGTAGNDSFSASSGDTLILGGAFGGGTDVVTGSNYTVDFSGYQPGTVAISGTYSIGGASGYVLYDQTTGGQAARFAPAANTTYTLIGTSGADNISGIQSGSTIFGGHGNDTYIPEVNNVSFGWAQGDGNDTLFLFNSVSGTQLLLQGWGTTVSSAGLTNGETVGSWQVTISGSDYIFANTSGQGGVTARFATGKLFTVASTVICFYPGTLVATLTGPRAVETLGVGDMVLTHDGHAKPIRWMGRQTVSTVFVDPLRVLPIRIAAGALADNMPQRDLLVSPDHALLLDGVLVQAGALVGLPGISRERRVPPRFTYHHVELADHSLILAEGVPAETFVDNIDRLAFDNWDEHEALYGHLPDIAELELPRAKSARQLPRALRRRLEDRAAA